MTNTQTARAKSIATGIKLNPEVAEYLKILASQLQRDRSFLINAIVMQHAQQNRGVIPPPEKIISL